MGCEVPSVGSSVSCEVSTSIRDQGGNGSVVAFQSSYVKSSAMAWIWVHLQWSAFALGVEESSAEKELVCF